MLRGRSPWSLPIPAPFFYPSMRLCQWVLLVRSRINPSAQPGRERKGGRRRKYQWYCTPVSTEEAPFMGQQNPGEAPDLISLGGSSSRNKGNQSLTWQSRHSFCDLPKTWAHWSTSVHAGTCTHAQKQAEGVQVSRREGRTKKQNTWGIRW